MDIVSLHERPEFADVCAAWSFGEWGCQVPGRRLEDSVTRYRQTAMNTSGLQRTFLAVSEDRPAGMISLKEHDHPDHKDLSPWLASLYIHPAYRDQGMGTTLIRHLENFAKNEMGIERLYLFTHTAPKLYEREGWKEIKNIRDPSGLRATGEVLFAKDLTNV